MTHDIKKRPILFSAPMVRALLNGTKTQTRRAVKTEIALGREAIFAPRRGNKHAPTFLLPDGKEAALAYCPYGKPDDQLWVRETWALDDEDNALFYRADVGHGGDADEWERNRMEGAPRYRWRPSIHMPRAASRITLEITGVRVERLHDISEADARAEGVAYDPGEGGTYWVRDLGCYSDSASGSYRKLWEQINGPNSWWTNPWVWVIEVQKVAV